MKLPQKASFGSEPCEIGPKVTIWGIRRTGFPPEDSPLDPVVTKAVGHCGDRQLDPRVAPQVAPRVA